MYNTDWALQAHPSTQIHELKGVFVYCVLLDQKGKKSVISHNQNQFFVSANSKKIIHEILHEKPKSQVTLMVHLD